jgi:hypothetical protein
MATLWAIAAFRRSRRLGAAALVVLAFIQTGSVALGWHYAVDGYAAIRLTIPIWTGLGAVPSPDSCPRNHPRCRVGPALGARCALLHCLSRGQTERCA